MADLPLPMDVLVEVLIRLPVKSILKFRCVAKSWRDLISSPLFIDRHIKNDSKQRVLLVKRDISRVGPSPNGEDQILSFHDPDFPELLVSPNLSIPICNDACFYACLHIHGPCNGHICIALGDIVFLCNPALREFKLLPPKKWSRFSFAIPEQCGFGFDPITDTYKVLLISVVESEIFGDYIGFDLYYSSSNSWKQINGNVPAYSSFPGFELTFKGTMHFYLITSTDEYPCIFCFDISTEAFRRMDFYDNFSSSEGDIRLMELNDNLAFIRYKNNKFEPQEMEIWVMKEYGLKESWTKQFVIGPYCVTCPLLFLKNELLLVESDDGQLAVCALNENRFTRFDFHGYHGSLSAGVYEESLISLDKVIDCDNSSSNTWIVHWRELSMHSLFRHELGDVATHLHYNFCIPEKEVKLMVLNDSRECPFRSLLHLQKSIQGI